MNLDETLAALEAVGTAQNRKVYGRHGVSGPLYGVSYAHLGKLAKRIGTDHDLAVGLWSSGNHDARVLATRIADPSKIAARTVDGWLRDCDCYPLTTAFAELVAKTRFARARADRWMRARGEWPSAAGWSVFLRLAEDPDAYSDAELAAQIDRIAAEIHGAPNRARYNMNIALVQIGLRSKALERQAIRAARRIGRVEVDHGATGCKTHDAEAFLRKTVAHRRAQAARVRERTASKPKPRKRAASERKPRLRR